MICHHPLSEPCCLSLSHVSSDIIDRKNPRGRSAVGSAVTHQSLRVCVGVCISSDLGCACCWITLLSTNIGARASNYSWILRLLSLLETDLKPTLFFSLDCSELNFNPDPESVCERLCSELSCSVEPEKANTSCTLFMSERRKRRGWGFGDSSLHNHYRLLNPSSMLQAFYTLVQLYSVMLIADQPQMVWFLMIYFTTNRWFIFSLYIRVLLHISDWQWHE